MPVRATVDNGRRYETLKQQLEELQGHRRAFHVCGHVLSEPLLVFMRLFVGGSPEDGYGGLVAHRAHTPPKGAHTPKWHQAHEGVPADERRGH